MEGGLLESPRPRPHIYITPSRDGVCTVCVFWNNENGPGLSHVPRKTTNNMRISSVEIASTRRLLGANGETPRSRAGRLGPLALPFVRPSLALFVSSSSYQDRWLTAPMSTYPSTYGSDYSESWTNRSSLDVESKYRQYWLDHTRSTPPSRTPDSFVSSRSVLLTMSGR